MNTEQIAIKFGVPTPETCVKLDWKDIENKKCLNATKYFWVVCPKTKKNILYTMVKSKYFENLYLPLTNEIADGWYEFYSAPQIHEIEKLLPLLYNIAKNSTTIYFDLLTYPNSIKTILECNNITESYAQIYLQLKEKGLL